MTAIIHSIKAGRFFLVFTFVILAACTAGCSGIASLTDKINPATATIPATVQPPAEAAATALAAITPKATMVINTPLPATAVPNPTLNVEQLADGITIEDISISFLPPGAAENAPYVPCEDESEGFIICSLPRGGYEKIRYTFTPAAAAGFTGEDLQRAMVEAKLAIYIYDSSRNAAAGKSLGRTTLKPGENGNWFGNLVLSTTNNAFVVQFVMEEKVITSSNLFIRQPAYLPTPKLRGAN